MKRERITVTVDPEWVAAGAAAVAEGRADSVSAWVSQAMAEKAANDRRLRFLDLAIADYEAEFGVITEAEMAPILARREANEKDTLEYRVLEMLFKQHATSSSAGRRATRANDIGKLR